MNSLKLVGKVRHVLEMVNIITEMMLETKQSDRLEDLSCEDLKELFDVAEMTGSYNWNESEKQAVAKLLGTS